MRTALDLSTKAVSIGIGSINIGTDTTVSDPITDFDIRNVRLVVSVSINRLSVSVTMPRYRYLILVSVSALLFSYINVNIGKLFCYVMIADILRPML